MTLRTLFLCIDGYQRREHHDMRKRAWEVAHHINIWSKDGVTPGQLIGDEKPAPIFTDAEEYRAYMREKRQREIRRQVEQDRKDREERMHGNHS